MSKAAGIQANSIRAQRRLLPVVQQRLVQVSNLLGFTLAELSTEALAGQTRLSGLSPERRWTMDEMVALYNVSAADCTCCRARLTLNVEVCWSAKLPDVVVSLDPD